MHDPDKKDIKTYLTHGAFLFLLAVCAVGSFLLGIESSEPEQFVDVQTAVADAPKPQTVDLKIKGDIKTHIYHLRGCANYNDISDRHVIWFKTEEEAESIGFKRSKNC